MIWSNKFFESAAGIFPFAIPNHNPVFLILRNISIQSDNYHESNFRIQNDINLKVLCADVTKWYNYFQMYDVLDYGIVMTGKSISYYYYYLNMLKTICVIINIIHITIKVSIIC